MATNITTIKASYITDNDGMNAAPSGINIGSLGANSLFVQGSDTLPSTVEKNDIIQIINDGNSTQVSSIWSNQAKGIDNYLDTGSKQTLSAWVYMGGSSAFGSEGMAFVLQNSGTTAIAKNGTKIAGGETLGVWGSDLSRKSTTSAMAASAIQKSWALEFDDIPGGLGSADTRNGSGGTLGNTLDSYQIGVNETSTAAQNRGFTNYLGHVAWAYPGDPKAYFKIGTTGGIPYYELNHNDIDETDFVTPKTAPLAWHHLTITYTPPDAGSTMAKLSYRFNDKTINGIASKGDIDQELVTRDISLDLSKLGATAGTPLYYGFTAANSSANSATNAVVFEELPSIVEANNNAYVVDETNKTKVSSSTDTMDTDDKALAETTTVHPKDKLRFNYMLQYQSGKQDMKPITATVDVPDNVTVTPDSKGNIGKVVYADGTSELIPGAKLDGKKLTYTIGKSLSLSNPTAIIELNATADDVTSADTALQVPLSHAVLEGDNYKADVQTPPFTIQASRATFTLQKSSDNDISTSPDHSVDLTGSMKIVENDTLVDQTIDNNDIDFYVSVDGGDAKLAKDTGSGSGQFTIPFTSSDVGTHTVTVSAVDPKYVGSDGIPDTLASNPVTYTVKVLNNDLSLISKKEYDFQLIHANDRAQTIDRQDDWGVEVNSTNTAWTLTAQSSSLTNDNGTFNGGLTFTNKDGSTTSLQASPVLIDKDTTVSTTPETTDVSGVWAKDQGILLHVNSGVVPSGKYNGTITWNLANSI